MSSFALNYLALGLIERGPTANLPFFQNDCKSRNNSVRIATGYGLDGRSSIPERDMRFVLLHSFQTDSEAHTASYRIQCVPEAWSWLLSSILRRRKKWRSYIFTRNVVLQRHTVYKTNAFLQISSTQFVSLHYMFRPDGAIFYNRLFLFLLLSPHWPVFTHWESVLCMVFICPSVVKCIAYEISKILKH
jgi:hypothetical protein